MLSVRYTAFRILTAATALASFYTLPALPSLSAAEVAPAAQAVIDFDRVGKKSEKELRIAYLSECTQNTYCQSRIKGMNDAAAKFGFTYKLYDPNFSTAEQLKQVQTAIAENFDGFIIGIIAAAPACTMFRQYLVPTGKPIVAIGLLGENVGSGLCSDNDYTAGLSGYVGMQRQEYYNAFVLDAFSRCQGECKSRRCRAASLAQIFSISGRKPSRSAPRNTLMLKSWLISLATMIHTPLCESFRTHCVPIRT